MNGEGSHPLNAFRIACEGPAWPLHLEISPNVINTYLECPHRLRLQYIDKAQRKPDLPSLSLAKGNAAHDVLRQCAGKMKAGKELPQTGQLRELIFNKLPKKEFPSLEAHQAHTADVMRWVTYGLNYIDPWAEFVLIEGKTHRAMPVSLERVTLMTRADLVLVHTEPNGERWVEFIDYKTGKQKEVPFVPVFTRVVLKERLRQLLPDVTNTRMQFTFLWLDIHTPEQIDLSLDYCTDEWERTTTLLEHLVTERSWPATPSSWNCRYCPFNGSVCDAYERLGPQTQPFEIA